MTLDSYVEEENIIPPQEQLGPETQGLPPDHFTKPIADNIVLTPDRDEYTYREEPLPIRKFAAKYLSGMHDMMADILQPQEYGAYLEIAQKYAVWLKKSIETSLFIPTLVQLYEKKLALEAERNYPKNREFLFIEEQIDLACKVLGISEDQFALSLGRLSRDQMIRYMQATRNPVPGRRQLHILELISEGMTFLHYGLSYAQIWKEIQHPRY